LLPRSPELVIALLAVTKTGAAYVPLHPEWPVERREWVCEQAGVSLVLTESVFTEVQSDRLLRYPDTCPEVTVYPDHLAYVMYTSGSTGEPKGVATRHRDVAALVRDRCWRGGAHQRVLVHSPHSFDASTYELWVPLLNGGQAVIAADGKLEAAQLAELMTSCGVTGLWLTAGLFTVMAEEHPHCFRDVEQVWAGGDVVSAEAVRRVQAACPRTVVVNGYGPTETTTFAAYQPIAEMLVDAAEVPIGRPLDN
ncbi:AMP-binding protein, partial [Nocardia terpenica]|uniref:AMP-binding protein n=1 Tax=Nocardia terpenica TaxID=455432 RepID=UPI002FE28DCB